MPYVYLIENQNNGKKYVGITKHTIEERFTKHKAESKTNTSRRLYQAMAKHGLDVFSCTLIEECVSEKIFEREMHWISHYRSNDYRFGYNMTAGGEGCVDREYSLETIEKLRTSITNHRMSLSLEERKQLTKKANAAKLGYTESEHSRALKREAQKARFANMSEEQRKEHGAKSKNGISEDGKKKQTVGMNNAFSPVRQKGYKHPLTSCPHCGKIGGVNNIKRWHMDNCKMRSKDN
jgi:group I intron endonuclease